MNSSGLMDTFKDREGVLFALHSVGAAGSSTPVVTAPGEKTHKLDFKKVSKSMNLIIGAIVLLLERTFIAFLYFHMHLSNALMKLLPQPLM
jgi:hypothetical protein